VIYLINIFRNVIGIKQIIVSLKEISIIIKKLCQFQATALCLIDDLYNIIVPESGRRILSVLRQLFLKMEILRQEQLKHIKL
jgi:hypothetical protein